MKNRNLKIGAALSLGAAAFVLASGILLNLPRMEPVEPVGNFSLETELAARQKPLNINTATLEELCELPGLGESKAKAVLEYRRKHGAFKSIWDLVKVKGISANMVSQWLGTITIREETDDGA